MYTNNRRIKKLRLRLLEREREIAYMCQSERNCQRTRANYTIYLDDIYVSKIDEYLIKSSNFYSEFKGCESYHVKHSDQRRG